ncbi:hypothetical protein ABPG72_010598 [Tetrahymena utriculariae]
MLLDSSKKMNDNILSFQNFDQADSEMQTKFTDRVSSVQNHNSKIGFSNRSSDILNNQEFSNIQPRMNDSQQQKIQQYDLVNKYIKNEGEMHHYNQHMFLSPRESPQKQSNRFPFLSPQGKQNSSLGYEDTKYGNFSVRYDYVLTENKQNTIQNQSYSQYTSGITNISHDTKNMNMLNQVGNTYQNKSEQQQNKKIEDIQYGLKKVLSTDSLFARKVITENENINNQGLIAYGLNGNQQQSSSNLQQSANQESQNVNYKTIINASSFATKFQSITNNSQRKNWEHFSDDEDNCIDDAYSPQYNYQTLKSVIPTNSNDQGKSFQYLQKFSSFPYPPKHQITNQDSQIGQKDLNQNKHVILIGNNNKSQTNQNLAQTYSFGNNQNLSTRLNTQDSQVSSRFTTKSIKNQFNDHKNVSNLNSPSSVRESSQYKFQILQQNLNNNDYSQFKGSSEVLSQNINTKNSQVLVNPVLQISKQNSETLISKKQDNNFQNLLGININYATQAQQQQNSNVHQIHQHHKFLTYNAPKTSREIDETTQTQQRDSIRGYNSQYNEHRYSLTKLDKYPCNYDFQTQKAREISPDNPIIEKLQKNNYQQTFTKQEEKQEEQFRQFKEDNSSQSSSGLYGSAGYNLGLKFNSGQQSDRINTNTNSFGNKGNLRESEQKHSIVSQNNINQQKSKVNSDVFKGSSYLKNTNNQEKNQFWNIYKYQTFIRENKNYCEDQINKVDQNLVILAYQDSFNDQTFFKSLIIIHFYQLILQENLDIYNLSLFDMYEQVNQKRIQLYSIPLKDIQEQNLQESYKKVMYDLVQMKNTSSKESLFEKFLYYFTNDATFSEALIQIMKQVIAQCCNQKDFSNEIQQFKHMILQNWFEIKPEFLPMLSNALNKVIEIHYLLDNKIETTVCCNLKNKFSAKNQKVIKIVYNYNTTLKKQYYMPLLTSEDSAYFKVQNSSQARNNTISIVAYLEQNKPTFSSQFSSQNQQEGRTSINYQEIQSIQKDDPLANDYNYPDSSLVLSSKNSTLKRLKDQVSQSQSTQVIQMQSQRQSIEESSTQLNLKMRMSPKKQQQQFRSSSDLCELQGTSFNNQVSNPNPQAHKFSSHSAHTKLQNESNINQELNLPKYDYQLLNKGDNKLKTAFSSEASLNNKQFEISPNKKSPDSSDSNNTNSGNYNFTKDQVLEYNDSRKYELLEKQQQQMQFNPKRLTEKLQAFMLFCKDNTTIIQDLFNQKKYQQQNSQANSKQNTQYQSQKTLNQQNQPLNQKVAENKFVQVVNGMQQNLKSPSPHYQQMSQQSLTSIQRATSPIHHQHAYTLSPQHNIQTPTTTNTNRVQSPNSQQRFNQFQNNNNNNNNNKNNTIMNTFNKFSDTMNIFNHFQTSNTPSISQNKLPNSNLGTPVNYLGNPNTKQANLDFQTDTQTYFTTVLNQKQFIYGKKF